MLDAATTAGEVRTDLDAYQLMRGVGNLCIGADSDSRYDARRLVAAPLAGLRTGSASSAQNVRRAMP